MNAKGWDDRLCISVEEAGRRAGVGRNTMYEWSRREDFPLLRVGRKKLVPVTAFERWLEDQIVSKKEA